MIAKPRRTWLAAALAGVAVIVLVVFFSGFSMSEDYLTSTRPDGKYRVVVSKKTSLLNLGSVPGSSGDAPGVVRLYNQQGKLMEETKVELVQQVEKVEWGVKSVYIKLVADWQLPD